MAQQVDISKGRKDLNIFDQTKNVKSNLILEMIVYLVIRMIKVYLQFK